MYLIGILILIIIGGCDPMVKRYQFEEISVHADNVIKEIVSMKNIAEKNGTYYFLTVNGSNEILSKSSSFGSDDTIIDTTFVGGAYSDLVVRQWGTNIYSGMIGLDPVGPNPSYLPRHESNNSGDTWAEDIESGLLGAGAVSNMVDITEIGGVGYWVYSLDFTGGLWKVSIRKFDGTKVDGSALKDPNSVFAGFRNADGNYQYLEFGADDKWYDVVFNGTTYTRTELTDPDLTPPDTWDNSRQLYWDTRDRHIILTGNQMYQKLNGVWTLTSVASEQDVVGVIWKKNGSDEYTFDYIIWNDGLYYVTVKGYLVKLQTLAVDARVGYDNWFSTGSAIWQNNNPTYKPANRVPITGGHLRAQSCNLLHIGTDFVKGSGIVLTDDSDNIKGIFVIDPKKGITAVGTTLQRIPFVSPGKFDLEEKVSYEFLSTTIPEMMTTDLSQTRFYYKGTIDANATEFDYSCNEIPRWQFWKEMEELGLKRINKSNELGEISMEDADVSSGVTVTHLNMTKKPKIQPQGAGFNQVIVIGGSKADGTGLAGNLDNPYNIPTSTDQQINLIIFIHPNRKTDVQCLADAVLIGDNVSTSLQSFNGSFIGQGKPLEGTVVNIAYAPDGLSATNFIVEFYTYELLTDIFDMDGLSALHWKGKDAIQLLEGTRAALNQLAIDVGNLIEGGSIWYLDDTNSDIGGYESLNMVYDADAEVDYSVASAVDGEAIQQFITAIGEPGITNLLEGQYGIHIHASKTGGTQNIAIYYEIYKRAHPGGGGGITRHSAPYQHFCWCRQ